jgi:hypothetical protein
MVRAVWSGVVPSLKLLSNGRTSSATPTEVRVLDAGRPQRPAGLSGPGGRSAPKSILPAGE